MQAADKSGQAMKGYFSPIKIVARKPLDEALEEAKRTGCVYVAMIEILHWEDRATEWSGRPDRVSIDLNIHEVETGRQIDLIAVRTDSTGAYRGLRPEDCIYRPLREYLAKRFGKRAPKP